MQVYLHSEYRQFRKVRKAGETVNVKDSLGAGLISRGLGCPVVDGIHQCRLAPFTTVAEPYLDEMLEESPANEVILPVKWSNSKKAHMRLAMRRSKDVRAVLNGRRFEEITPGMLK